MRDVQQQKFSVTAGEKAESATAVGDSLTVPYKTKQTLTVSPTVTLLDVYPKGLKTYIHTNTCTWTLNRCFINNCQNLLAAQIPFRA